MSIRYGKMAKKGIANRTFYVEPIGKNPSGVIIIQEQIRQSRFNK